MVYMAGYESSCSGKAGQPVRKQVLVWTFSRTFVNCLKMATPAMMLSMRVRPPRNLLLLHKLAAAACAGELASLYQRGAASTGVCCMGSPTMILCRPPKGLSRAARWLKPLAACLLHTLKWSAEVRENSSWISMESPAHAVCSLTKLWSSTRAELFSTESTWYRVLVVTPRTPGFFSRATGRPWKEVNTRSFPRSCWWANQQIPWIRCDFPTPASPMTSMSSCLSSSRTAIPEPSLSLDISASVATTNALAASFRKAQMCMVSSAVGGTGSLSHEGGDQDAVVARVLTTGLADMTPATVAG